MIGIIKAEMGRRDLTTIDVSKKMHCHVNTVRNDLKDPETTPQSRLWLYFAVLGMPLDNFLATVAAAYANHIVSMQIPEIRLCIDNKKIG